MRKISRKDIKETISTTTLNSLYLIILNFKISLSLKNYIFVIKSKKEI